MTAVVLGRGMDERLPVMPQTREVLRRAGIEVQVEPTRAAVEPYNRLAATERVGGLFHPPC
ncbi:MTH938/NDUFAF3 family protein [Streptomyces sp. NPDC058646]|uniref:MTH938/NDUFAF3 family protein n=1 Tax=Streptomyces sp. NPDC058646 TaxID=3346574 RepID=UPI00365BCBE9